MAYRDTSAPWLRTRSNQYTRGIRSRVMEVHSGGFEKKAYVPSRSCALNNYAASIFAEWRRWSNMAVSTVRLLLFPFSTPIDRWFNGWNIGNCSSFAKNVPCLVLRRRARVDNEREKNSSRDEYTKIEILQITNRKEWYPKCRGIFYLSFASLTDLKKYTRKWSVLVNIIYIKMHQKKSLFQKRSCITRFEIKYDYRCEPFL